MKKEELSKFQKGLKQLNAPYKKNEAYEIFRNKRKNPNISVFWDTDAGYISKYKNVNMNKNENGLENKRNIEPISLFDDESLKELRELNMQDMLPLERQEELFNEIVLGIKEETKIKTYKK